MPLDGLVERVSVALNQHVRAGQPLARIQSPALIEAQRALLQASTQHQLAQRTVARDAELHREGIIAESRYLSAKSAETEAAAALAERRQLLALYGMSGAAIQKLLTSRQLSPAIELVAPADGVVLELPAAPGQRLQAAAPIARLASLASLWLEVQLPASRIYAVAPGSRVQIPAAGAVGRVRSVGSAVHPENQTVAVHVQITEGARLLRPGQSVEAVIELAHSRGACWQIPPGTLARIEGKTFVFVQVAEGFRPVAVDVSEESGSGPCVDGPLGSEDRIAVRGIAALKARLAGIGGP